MRKLSEFITRPYIDLVFSLLCGAEYYIIVLYFVISHTAAGGGLLAFFFLPAIVAGGALIVLKTIKQLKEGDMHTRIGVLVIMHILLIAADAVFIADMIK